MFPKRFDRCDLMTDVNDKKPPRPGTPEYDDFVEDQAQSAMDRALAMPLVRIFFGLMFLMFTFSAGSKITDGLVAPDAQERVWNVLNSVLMFLPMLLGSGYVALYGKSRTPWMRDGLRSYRPKQTNPAGISDGHRLG